LARTNIQQFRANGCQVSINNFGASLNAMGLLDHLEIDLVKIDRSFIQDLSNEENVQATKNMTAEVMTHNGTQVMVAYIENPTAMSKAWSMGARYLQGYYLQMPSEEMVFE
jgi:EAL domain-containing protein (putative c-di-GMP-specific phosphodiesterase class I)